MTFSEAKREFDVRYYLWSISEFKKEIEASFPTLRLFKAGGPWKTYQYMLKLTKSDQFILASSLLKRSHPNAVKSLCETCSVEEESLRARKDASFSNILSFGDELQERKAAGEPIKLASKRKLRKLMGAKFKAVFGDKCLDLKRTNEDEQTLLFKMRFFGWNVVTSFWFGRGTTVLEYSHKIESEDAFPYRGGIVGMGLAGGISFNSYLGIGASEWNYILDDEIDPICETVAKLSARFFDALPALLEGIEYEVVTFDGADIRGC